MTAFGVTTWAVNRVGWAFGYYGYSNPYAGDTVVIDNSVYDYSQPLVMTADEQSLSEDNPLPESEQTAGLDEFDQARQAFFAGDYDAALKSTDAALKIMPNDAVIHEFRALIMFATGKYHDSAAILYAVLGVGPGWDWTTMIGLYEHSEDYTKQLRALEQARDNSPEDPALRFVLAYHYQTAGHKEAAAKQLEKLVSINPQDSLAVQLLMELNPDAEIPKPPKQVEPPKPSKPVTADELKGNWAAERGGGTFTMVLNADNSFSWKYTQGDKSQEVTGNWSIDDDGVLALKMNDEGVMLAQIVPQGSTIDFYMLGDTQGEEPLHFAKK